MWRSKHIRISTRSLCSSAAFCGAGPWGLVFRSHGREGVGCHECFRSVTVGTSGCPPGARGLDPPPPPHPPTLFPPPQEAPCPQNSVASQHDHVRWGNIPGGQFRFSDGCPNSPPRFFLRNLGHLLLPRSAAHSFLLQGGARVLRVRTSVYAGAYPNRFYAGRVRLLSLRTGAASAPGNSGCGVGSRPLLSGWLLLYRGLGGWVGGWGGQMPKKRLCT